MQILDKIRFEFNHNQDDTSQYDEFCWFAREYPRCYRYRLACARYRLESIRDLMETIHQELAHTIETNPGCFEAAVADERTIRVYWDFESYLSEINMALDLLTRIVGTAYSNQKPVHFKDFCNKAKNDAFGNILQSARNRWVNRLKNYRDCYTHYTPVDTILSVSMVHYKDGFHTRGKLPVNPNTRDISRFRFNRRTELLSYACSVWRHMTALDRAVAKQIAKEYRNNNYPLKFSNLLFVGQRTRK